MVNNKNVAVAYFGNYNPQYTRVRTTLKGLKRAGISVVECNGNASGKFIRLFILAKKYLKIAPEIDIIMVSEAGQSYVPLAKLLAFITKKPLLFDAFLSYYHVKIEDEKIAPPDSLKAKYFYLLDKISCRLADLIILDTPEHAEYFSKTFNMARKKIKVIPVGSDEEIFYPIEKNGLKKEFLVFLVSSFYPLHGIEYVLEAAKLIKKYNDVKFLIVGDGPTKETNIKLAKKLDLDNTEFKGRVSPEELANLMENADICLGQFGKTQQTQMVVPAKIYDAIAMAKPIITAQSTSVKSIFKDKESIIFCQPANPRSLAESIILLKENNNLRQKIVKNGHKIFQEKFSLIKIGEMLKSIIKNLISKNA